MLIENVNFNKIIDQKFSNSCLNLSHYLLD